jgi:hypothetical protein
MAGIYQYGVHGYLANGNKFPVSAFAPYLIFRDAEKLNCFIHYFLYGLRLVRLSV